MTPSNEKQLYNNETNNETKEQEKQQFYNNHTTIVQQ
jgi:hypothetical protein